MYRQLVHEITQTFKKIADKIVEINRKIITQYNLTEVAKFMEKIQDDEKIKLELVSDNIF